MRSIATRRHALVACFATVAALASLASAQKVWVVAPALGPGVDTTSIAAATSAAADGDLVLVRPGVYTGFVIASKSLTVAADTGGDVIATSAWVTNLGATQSVALRGLKIRTPSGPAAFPYSALQLSSNAGPVLVENCELITSLADSSLKNGWIGVDALNCASTSFTRCTLRGGTGLWGSLTTSLNGGDGGIGLRCENCRVFLFDTEVRGGDAAGGAFPFSHGGTGGMGALVFAGSSMFASGSSISGGPGGPMADCIAVPGAGGIGISNPQGRADLLDTTLTGGPGGAGACGAAAGPAGLPFSGNAPTILAGGARHFDASSPVREQQLTTLHAQGLPGEHAGALVSLDPQVGIWPFFLGAPLLLSLANATAIDLGALDPSGSAAVAVVAPSLGPSIDGVVVQLQSFFFDLPPSYVVLGPVSTLLLLDASF